MNTVANTDKVTQIKNLKPVVSVVIPSYNYAKNISHCLTPLLSQNCSVPYEVIMIDTSTDGTDLVVSKEFPEIQMFHFNERKYVGEARNAGIDRSNGEFIFFLDQDCVVPSDWIERMYRVFKNTQADGVGGSIENGTPKSITGTVGYYLEFFRFFPRNSSNNRHKLITNSFLVGGNCAFRKELFNTARYYDNYDKTKIGEDFYFIWQLSKQGKKLLYDPSISVKHVNKTGLKVIFQYQYKIGKSACAFRNQVSNKFMPLFLKSPYLSLGIPLIIVPLIGLHVLKSLGIKAFANFVALLPLIFIGNYVWAVGFLRELKAIIKSK